MSSYRTSNWAEYWKLFDELIASLEVDEKLACVAELKDAQLWANGLTDGWFEFLTRFEDCFIKNKRLMTTQQAELASFLTKSLRTSLISR